MSELNAILTVDDKLEFAAWLCEEHSARFVVDDDLPTISEVTEVGTLRSVLLQEFPPLIFVLSDRWSTLPLYKARAMNQYKGEIHYVVQRYGGPAFTWVPGNYLRNSTSVGLSAGLFGDYASYYIAPGSDATIQRPLTMTAAFRAAQRWVRKLCDGRRTVYKRGGAAGPWISDRAWKLVNNGSATLANDGLVIARADVA